MASAYFAAWVLIKFPAAAPITDAFHDSMNSAPVPYMNANNTQNIMTFTLLRNILFSSDIFATFPVTCWFRFAMVWVCILNIFEDIADGSTTYQSVYAIENPMNTKNRYLSAWACSFNSVFSPSTVAFFLSSVFIVA